MIEISNERAEDAEEVEALYDLAFAPGRGGLSSYQLREGVAPIGELCLAVRDAFCVIVAAIRYWPIQIGGEQGGPSAPALLLGPIAVHPIRQGEGLGAQLMFASLEKARGLGWKRVVLVGDEPYYRRFGFTRRAASDIQFPEPVNPTRVLALELVPGGMDGVWGRVRKAGASADALDRRDG